MYCDAERGETGEQSTVSKRVGDIVDGGQCFSMPPNVLRLSNDLRSTILAANSCSGGGVGDGGSIKQVHDKGNN